MKNDLSFFVVSLFLCYFLAFVSFQKVRWTLEINMKFRQDKWKWWVCMIFLFKTKLFLYLYKFYYCTHKKTTIHYKASHLASMSESSISKQIAHSCNKKKYILEISQTMIKVGIFNIFWKNLPSVKYHDHDFDHIYQENHQYNVPKWSKELLLETIHVLKSHCHEVCHPNHTISK